MNRLSDSGYITTASGRRFWPLDPHPDDVAIRDIAASLARTVRWRGHFTRQPFYSVAEHSVLLARHGRAQGWPSREVLHALLHDAAEAYLCDVPSPVKALLPGYAAIERRVEAAVWAAFGLPPELPVRVHEADQRIRSDEIEQLGRADPAGDLGRLHPLGVTLACWAPGAAEWNFIAMFERLAGPAALDGGVPGPRHPAPDT